MANLTFEWERKNFYLIKFSLIHSQNQLIACMMKCAKFKWVSLWASHNFTTGNFTLCTIYLKTEKCNRNYLRPRKFRNETKLPLFRFLIYLWNRHSNVPTSQSFTLDFRIRKWTNSFNELHQNFKNGALVLHRQRFSCDFNSCVTLMWLCAMSFKMASKWFFLQCYHTY